MYTLYVIALFGANLRLNKMWFARQIKHYNTYGNDKSYSNDMIDNYGTFKYCFKHENNKISH